jgi:hypothetical protein
MDAALADNIRRKGARFRGKDLNADDEYDFDGGIEMYESRKKKGTKVCAALQLPVAGASSLQKRKACKQCLYMHHDCCGSGPVVTNYLDGRTP